MAITSLSRPFYFPALPISIGLSSLVVLDGTYSRVAFVGTFWSPNGLTAINKIAFRFNTIVKAGGSGIRVSLQDWSGSSILQPDGTQDQFIDIANGDAGFVSNASYLTGSLSADRTVANGDKIAVVFQWDGSGRLGSDSVVISSIATSSLIQFAVPGCVRYNGSAWSNVDRFSPSIVFEDSGGLIGTLAGDPYIAAMNSPAVVTFSSSNGTHDELGNLLQYPVSVETDGCWVQSTLASASADYDVVLYDSDGTTVLRSVTTLANQRAKLTDAFCFYPFASPVTLLANASYRIVMKPTTTNNVSLSTYIFHSAAHVPLVGGANCGMTGRVDNGSWANPYTTRIGAIGLSVSGVDAGGGGGAAGFPLGRLVI